MLKVDAKTLSCARRHVRCVVNAVAVRMSRTTEHVVTWCKSTLCSST